MLVKILRLVFDISVHACIRVLQRKEAIGCACVCTKKTVRAYTHTHTHTHIYI